MQVVRDHHVAMLLRNSALCQRARPSGSSGSAVPVPRSASVSTARSAFHADGCGSHPGPVMTQEEKERWREGGRRAVVWEKDGGREAGGGEVGKEQHRQVQRTRSRLVKGVLQHACF